MGQINLDEIFEQAYAEAYALNMQGWDGTEAWEREAREYAREYAAGEVEAATELAREGRYSEGLLSQDNERTEHGRKGA